MHRPLNEELSNLNAKLLTMASYTETGVIHAVKALVDHDDALARSVEDRDGMVDQLEVEIDEMTIHLLSRAPLASSLRLIFVAGKIAHNLERVADEATTISRRTLELNQEPQLKYCQDIPQVAQIVVDMLKTALDAFVTWNSEKARSVIPLDKQVDHTHKLLQRELANYMAENPKTISRCLNLIVVSKAIERIGDHAKNIAEEVVYLCDAEDIRYQSKLHVA